MKNLFKILCMMIGMVVCISNTSVAQTPPNWEDLVVDMFVWGTANANIPADDTIAIGDLHNETFNGYLPIIVECPDIAEYYDLVAREIVGYSKYIRVNDGCQITARIPGTHDGFGGIIIYDAYTRPAQMVPFTDIIYVEEGKKHTLKPWHWVPYEEGYVIPRTWSKDGEYIEEFFGMKKIDIYGPAFGDTAIYEVYLRDTRLGYSITNTFIVIGKKSDFGVEDNEISNISIYPNPSNDGVVTLRGEGIAEIFNILGQKVKEVEIMEETKVSLPSGLYFVRAGSATQKVVVR